jgi:hypothetical protein
MREIRKRFPITFYGIVVLLLAIPICIVLHFTVGTEVFRNVFTPFYCAIVIVAFIEIKVHKDK